MNQAIRPILGESPKVLEMIALIRKVALAKTSILIIGESGTGKELVARMIHEESGLKGRPFVAVNCGAIPENLIESEMFGHKKGSFTGAVSDKPGLFETANGGTLFLDEIGELPLSLQVKLLRALQERVIRRVGGNDDIKIETRIIAATNRNLESAVAKGTFREDLYYRLNVIQVNAPPLRDRGNDVILLAHHFAQKYAEKQGKAVLGFDPDVEEALRNYPWPGNVRELENTMERVVTLAQADRISWKNLPDTLKKGGKTGEEHAGWLLPFPNFSRETVPLQDRLAQIEKEVIELALKEAKGVVLKAAKSVEMDLPMFEARLKKYGIQIPKN